MTNHPNREISSWETKCQRAIRDLGWRRARYSGLWLHPDHAAWGGSAAEAVEFFHIDVIENGHLANEQACKP